MNRILLGIIGVLVICTVGLGIFVYSEHSSRVKAEQQVETLIVAQNNLQEYIKQKNSAYEKLNVKYNHLKATQPSDLCGDTIVSDEIIEWLQGVK